MKQGQRFYHARVLTEDKAAHQLYQVSRVTNDMIYYRPVYDAGLPSEWLGKSECCNRNSFSGISGKTWSHHSDTALPTDVCGLPAHPQEQ